MPPRWPARVIALGLVLGGGAVSGWPVVETWLNNEQGSRDTAAYVAAVHDLTTSDAAPLATALGRAHAYNQALAPAALWDPWGEEEPGRSASHDEYAAQLSDFDAMARIRVPQIGVDLPVFHDATKVPLSRGAGHMYGTSLPVGGPDTHAVIAAHTGLKGRTMFDRLPEVQAGDLFFVDVYGVTLTYRVDQIVVVEPWELEAVARQPGGDQVTLVTCYTPPGEHKQRLLVRGVRVSDEPTRRATTPVPVAADLSIQEWMWPRLGVSAGAVAVSGLMLLPGGRRQREQAR